ncbi:hypothetical protein AAMO2058_001574100 [Amorphochlora amoebiformis]
MVSRSRVGRVVVSRCLILQKLFRYSRKSMWYVLGLFGCLSLFLVHVAITKKAIEDAVQRAKLLESGKNPIPNLNFNTVKQLNPFEINPLFNKTLRARSKFNITPASTLHVFLQKDYTFMFHPVVMTLKLGAYASSIPYVVRYIPQPQFLKVLETIQNDEEHQGLAAKLVLGEHSPMPHLRDHVSDGDVVVWIGPLAFPWEALSHRKVYLVHAQMEPLGLHGCDFGFILKSAEHVHEMWHYSLRNKRIMETTCKDGISPDVVHRYMPIAYDPFMTKIVQKDASNPGLDSSKITFLGALEFGNRRECWDIIVKTSPNDIKSLYNTRYDLFSAPQLKSFLKRSGGLYLNIHKVKPPQTDQETYISTYKVKPPHKQIRRPISQHTYTWSNHKCTPAHKQMRRTTSQHTYTHTQAAQTTHTTNAHKHKKRSGRIYLNIHIYTTRSNHSYHKSTQRDQEAYISTYLHT